MRDPEAFVRAFATYWRDRWSASGDALFIEFRLIGTIAGRRVEWPAASPTRNFARRRRANVTMVERDGS